MLDSILERAVYKRSDVSPAFFIAHLEGEK